mgnify:CR=1 FL=1
MKRRSFIKLSAATAGCTSLGFWPSCTPVQESEALDKLSEVFLYPGNEAKPFMRWWWNGNRITADEIDRELDILEAYLSLSATRFGESLQVRFDIEPGQGAKGIIPLSLQMLVENVVKHNDIREDQPLRIAISSRDGILWVRNERRATVAKRGTTGLGLQNIRDRYRHLTGKNIVVQQEADIFCVGLPLIPMHDERRIDRG